MNRLQLTQRLLRECGVSGTGPSTTISQSGELGRLVDWIDTAWLEIQEERPNWNWMVGSFSFETTASDYEYTTTDVGIDTTFANWRIETLRSYLTAAGVGTERYMNFMEYDSFRDYYLFNTRTTSLSQPYEFTVSPPDKRLLLGPNPNDIYTVRGEYYKLPVAMTADADTPGMPERFHMAIVYRAMMDYASYESAPEVYERGFTKYTEIMRRLEDDQMPTLVQAGALV